MDNFRKPQRPRSRPSGIDGIVNQRKRTQPRQHASPTPRTPASPRSVIGNGARLDDFKRPNGFNTAARSQLNRPQTTLAQPTPRPLSGTTKLDLPPSGIKRDRKSKFRHKRSKRKLVLRSVLALLLIVMLTGGYLTGKGYLKARNIFKGGADSAAALQENVDPVKLKGEGDGRINILLLGRGGEGWDGPDLTDTIIIASIDPIQKNAALLSIPRDLWVKPEGYSYTKINSVFANAKYAYMGKNPKESDLKRKSDDAGFDSIESLLEQYMGIPIQYHAIIDFTGFQKAIDTVGGVTINVKEEVNDPTMAWMNKNNPVIAKVGVQNFDGYHALMYARSRHGSLRGDFDRATRQREVIVALKEKVLSVGTLSNPVKVSQLISAFGDHISTNLSQSEVMRLYAIGKDIPSNEITSVGLADPPNNFVITDNINGISIVRPRAGIDDYSEIQNYIRNAMRDGFLKKEDANVMVFNGTNTPGLAGKKAAILKSYGYTVTTVADAPTKNYTNTILVDLTKGVKKYTKRYLEQRLGVTAVTTLPDSTINSTGADFVIILGSNESTSSQN